MQIVGQCLRRFMMLLSIVMLRKIRRFYLRSISFLQSIFLTRWRTFLCESRLLKYGPTGPYFKFLIAGRAMASRPSNLHRSGLNHPVSLLGLALRTLQACQSKKDGKPSNRKPVNLSWWKRNYTACKKRLHFSIREMQSPPCARYHPSNKAAFRAAAESSFKGNVRPSGAA